MSTQLIYRPNPGFIFLTLLGLLVALPDAHADRRTSLNGNRLIVDQDDVFVYPHLLSEYDNRARFDYGADDESGSGLVSLRVGDLVWGVGLNRGTILDPQISRDGEITALDSPSFPLIQVDAAGTPLPPFVGIGDTYTAVDAFLSLGNLGFRLGMGGGGSSLNPNSGGSTGTTHEFFTASAGYRFADTEAFRLDTGANAVFGLAEDFEDGGTVLSGSVMGLRLDGRAFWKTGENSEFGTFGEIEVLRQAATADQVAGSPAAVGIQYGLAIGAGPVFTLPRNTTFATYVVAGLGFAGADPSSEADDDQVSELGVLFPGVRAAFETALLDWLYLRTGMRYDFVLDSASFEGAGSQSSRDGSFNWNAGLGFDFGAVKVDATLSPQVINSGTFLLSGTPQNPFAIVSATLAWDEIEPFSEDTPEPSELDEDETPTEEQAAENQDPTQTPTDSTEPTRQPATSDQPGANPDALPSPTTPTTTPTSAPVTPPPADDAPADATPGAGEAKPERTEPFEPQVYSFPEEGRNRVNDGTTQGTVSDGWQLWYDGEPWGTGHRVRSKGGEQVIAVNEGSYGLTREVGDVGGRTLKIQHRFTGGGFYEVMANDETIARYTEQMYEVQELDLPEGTTRITLKLGSLQPDDRAAATIMKVEIY